MILAVKTAVPPVFCLPNQHFLPLKRKPVLPDPFIGNPLRHKRLRILLLLDLQKRRLHGILQGFLFVSK